MRAILLPTLPPRRPSCTNGRYRHEPYRLSLYPPAMSQWPARRIQGQTINADYLVASKQRPSKPPEQPVDIVQLHRRAFAFRATAAEFLLQLMGPQALRFPRHQGIAGIILR